MLSKARAIAGGGVAKTPPAAAGVRKSVAKSPSPKGAVAVAAPAVGDGDGDPKAALVARCLCKPNARKKRPFTQEELEAKTLQQLKRLVYNYKL